SRFSTGRAPGSPRQTGQTFVFGGGPKPVAQPQNIWVRVPSWTCTSSPITGSYFAMSSGAARSVANLLDYPLRPNARPDAADQVSRHDDRRAIDRVVPHRGKRIIRLVERENGRLRLKPDLRRQIEKIARVGPGHAGYAPDLALTPEQPVVIELRHAVEGNRIDRKNP